MSRSTKPWIMGVLCITVMMTAVSSTVLAELKIGYIRPQYVFSKYEPYKAAQKELEKYEKEKVAELQKSSDKFQLEVQDAEKRALLMSEEMIQKKREELQKTRESLDKQYDDLYRQPDGLLMKKQTELLQPIINRINEVLMKIGKDEGYDFIFDAEGPVLYANEKYDISDYLLEEIQKDIPSK
ncbi:OmpH family outer membrane protein [bacterium]|nr:OmpH family outer membrane protein [bacterium]